MHALITLQGVVQERRHVRIRLAGDRCLVGAAWFGEHVELADVVDLGLMPAAAGIVPRR